VDVEMQALPRPARLADFARLQAEHLQEEMEVLEGDWKLQVGAPPRRRSACSYERGLQW
jgi:hypothetical protein